jgi:hypothetical protein
MPIDMYDQSLCQHLFHRDKRQPFTKARQAEVQASYYQRRGWFHNKKRMLFKLLQLEAKQYAPIESMAELDAFSKQYLMDNYQLDIPIRPTLFLMKCAKHIPSALNNPLESPLRALPLTTRRGGTESPLRALPLTTRRGGTESPLRAMPLTTRRGGTESPETQPQA